MREVLSLVPLLVFSPTAAGQQPAPQKQIIHLFSFGYDPKPIVLEAGKPVTLTFVNRSKSSHDFTAKKFFASSRMVSGDAPGGEIDLDGGQSRSVTLVPAAGQYKVHCGHTMHSLMGMQTDIIVR